MVCANENFDNCPLCLYYKVKIHESAMQLLQKIQGYHNHKKKDQITRKHKKLIISLWP